MKIIFCAIMLQVVLGCAYFPINSGSSVPVSGNEAGQYKKELMRCFRVGGSRIVKIGNLLRCF